MLDLLKSAGALAADVAAVVLTPVRVVTDLAAAAVHPVAEAAKEMAEAAKRAKD